MGSRTSGSSQSRKILSYVERAFCSAARSSVKSVIGSPFNWKYAAVRRTGSSLRIDAERVVDKAGVEPRLLDLLRREILRQLVENRRDHFEMREFLSGDIGQHALHFVGFHRVALVHIAKRSAELAIRSAERRFQRKTTLRIYARYTRITRLCGRSKMIVSTKARRISFCSSGVMAASVKMSRLAVITRRYGNGCESRLACAICLSAASISCSSFALLSWYSSIVSIPA